jgi:hypothetical protein
VALFQSVTHDQSGSRSKKDKKSKNSKKFLFAVFALLVFFASLSASVRMP